MYCVTVDVSMGWRRKVRARGVVIYFQRVNGIRPREFTLQKGTSGSSFSLQQVPLALNDFSEIRLVTDQVSMAASINSIRVHPDAMAMARGQVSMYL